ncbi:hypothetical protein [Sphingomonas sp.]|uniref:hypothetical protein n=1 Tax=Sphingomonas sp. TaxID=28214 RepID=UPI003B00213B
MIPDLDFSKIRAEGGDRREGFEEFSAQLFRQLKVPAGAQHQRYRGAGGDGGVEAIWRLPSGRVTGLQSKFFLPLKAAHKAQLEKSLDTALDNHPTLETYIVTLPFDPTPTIAARSGTGTADTLEAWRKDLVDLASRRGATVAVEWWMASDLKSRFLGMDNTAGRNLYWFGTTHLDAASLKSAADVAERIAGPRYSPSLRVGTDATDTLKAFGLDPGWSAVTAGWGHRVRAAVDSWRRWVPGAHAFPAQQILAALETARTCCAAVEALTFTEAQRHALQTLCVATLPVAQFLEATLKAEFDATHGAENDTVGWRQFQSAYQVAFPAADLDRSRDAIRLLGEMMAFAESPSARAAGADILLMRGPAGIGKTHTTIDATKERVAAGRAALTILGQEITSGQTLWSVIAAKLGLSAATTKGEMIGMFSAYAESTGAPFVIMVDAVNETPDRRQWQSWLPQLEADLRNQPIKLLLTCRDIFVEDALGAAGAALISFTHAGFAGREYDAAYSFAAFYKVGPPAEVVAQPEFANPLFLHLVCRAALSMNWGRIPGGQVSLTRLIAAILDGANVKAAELLDYDARIENPVRDGAAVLAALMGQRGARSLPLGDARTALEAVRGSEKASTSLLRAMEEGDLVSVSADGGGHHLRFAFERLGDVLIAQANLSGHDKASVEARFLSGDLAALVASPQAVAAHAGLIQAYSILLPEMLGIEIADLLQGSAVNREVTVLALGVLVWRDLESFNSTAWVLRHGRFIDLITLFDQVLAVAAVPGHPLNADWLDALLQRYPLIDRDALWTKMLTQAWEQSGPAQQLVRIAREQDLAHLSVDSATLLGVALAWMTGCADLLIRDQASQALTRLMIAQAVGAAVLDRFIDRDDDFTRERVLNSAYGAGLLQRDDAYWGEIADIVFTRLFATGMPPANVVLRDLGRMIVEQGVGAGTMTCIATAALVRPPFTSAWPLTLTYTDWQALEQAHPDLPGNLELGKSFAPDFARYCVEPQLRPFELAAAGLTVDFLKQWIVEQILALGYEGANKFALAYDWELVRRYGQERGVPSRHRRVSKKHQWIFLSRLLGQLHDHVPYRTSSWDGAPNPSDLQAIELRTLDPTDLGEDQADPIPGVGLTDFFTPAPASPGKQDPKDWVAALSGSQTIKLVAKDWVMLSGYQDWRHEDKASDLSRLGPRRVQSLLVPDRKMRTFSKKIAASIPRSSIPELSYLYDGEFPMSVAFNTHPGRWPLDADIGRHSSAIINRLEDPETPVHDLWVPAPELVAYNVLLWDGARSWMDVSEQAVAAQIGGGGDVALLFEKARMADYLQVTKTRLVWILFESRTALQGYDSLGSVDRHQAWSWNGKTLSKLGEEEDIYNPDDEREDEDEDDAEGEA